MAALWIALALLLTAQTNEALIGENTGGLGPYVPPTVETLTPQELHGIITPLRNTYRSITPEMYSFAAAIPRNPQRRYEANSVITANPSLNVRQAYDTCRVYSNGLRLVAATMVRYSDAFLRCRDQEVSEQLRTTHVRTWADLQSRNVDGTRAEHAEFRVLDKFHSNLMVINSGFNFDDLMIVYCHKTPCLDYCMSGGGSTAQTRANARPPSIIGHLTNAVRRWTNYRYVFTELYTNPRQSLEMLGSVIGLENVYRCTDTECFCCKGLHGHVLDRCYQNTITNPGVHPGANVADRAG